MSQETNKKQNDKETIHPEMAIIWGRRAKRDRVKQKKIARQEKNKQGKRNIKKDRNKSNTAPTEKPL